MHVVLEYRETLGVEYTDRVCAAAASVSARGQSDGEGFPDCACTNKRTIGIRLDRIAPLNLIVQPPDLHLRLLHDHTKFAPLAVPP
jgi:hypothetical protein